MFIDSTACTAEQFFHESLYRPPFQWISPAVGIFASIAFVSSVVYIYWKGGEGNKANKQNNEQQDHKTEQQDHKTRLSKLIIGSWTLLPPLWFMFEYWWLLGYLHMGRDHCIETLTTRQELASKFWVAAVLILVAIYKRDVPQLSG